MTQDLIRWHTWREITQQPAVWRAWGAAFDLEAARGWIAEQAFDEVWFCGAGTSAYIGDILAAQLPGTRSVPSTDLVARPRHLLQGRHPLVVSFGRSGNSAESLGTLDVLDALAPEAPRLNITCNGESTLATRASSGPNRSIVLPPETHDQGFAMTSSFSTMLLTALALFDAPCDFSARMSALAEQAEAILAGPQPAGPPARVVMLGTGPLAFAAREAALKVMELTVGDIPTLWDSTLGFRHGPKSFVTEDTLVTLFLSDEVPATAYEQDLALELSVQFPNTALQTVGPGGTTDIAMPYGAIWAAPLCVLTAQIASVVWSDAMGLNVDDPFAGRGTLSRVVADVRLHGVGT